MKFNQASLAIRFFFLNLWIVISLGIYLTGYQNVQRHLCFLQPLLEFVLD